MPVALVSAGATSNEDAITAAVERDKWTSSCNITGDWALPQPIVLTLLLDSNDISHNAQMYPQNRPPHLLHLRV